MKDNSKGFTLIELLVVIAIIGLLASIVLTALDKSRGRGINSSIKANMRTISQQVEMQFLGVFAGTYGTPHTLGPCTPATAGSVFEDATIQKAVAEIQRQSGSTPTCVSTASQWAVATPLKIPEAGSVTYWCIETEGKAKGETGNITGTSCP